MWAHMASMWGTRRNHASLHDTTVDCLPPKRRQRRSRGRISHVVSVAKDCRTGSQQWRFLKISSQLCQDGKIHKIIRDHQTSSRTCKLMRMTGSENVQPLKSPPGYRVGLDLWSEKIPLDHLRRFLESMVKVFQWNFVWSSNNMFSDNNTTHPFSHNPSSWVWEYPSWELPSFSWYVDLISMLMLLKFFQSEPVYCSLYSTGFNRWKKYISPSASYLETYLVRGEEK